MKVRIVNNYRLIYKPDWNSAMSSENWKGYVYEHIYIAEKALKRTLFKGEIVHHLNGNRADNRICNLLVISQGQHIKLHKWIERGAPFEKSNGKNGMNSGESKVAELKYCKICNITLSRSKAIYCSPKCASIGTRKVERPSYNQLIEDIKKLSMLAIGKKYKVSDNAVRKWIRQYKLLRQS